MWTASVIQLLVIFGAQSATSRETAETIPGLHSGILFQPRGSLVLATGTWTAVVQFEEEEVRLQARGLRQQFGNISDALIEMKRKQQNVTVEEERTRGEAFFSRRVDMWERERNWMEAEVNAAEDEMEELRAEMRAIRRARSLIPFIGDGLKWLFGTSTEQDARKLREEIRGVKTKVGKLHHIAELQTTLITSLKKEQRTNKRNIALLAEKSLQLERTLAVTREATHLTARSIRREIDMDQIITSAIRIAGAATLSFRREVGKIRQALSDAQEGRVTPSMLSSRNLRKTLHDIRNHLPEGWTPAVSRSDTPVEVYSLLTLKVLPTPGGWQVHIQIPLRSQSYGNFRLYEIRSIPTHFLNSSMALKTETPAEYFAISSDQRLHFTAQASDIAACRRAPRHAICDKMTPLIREEREGCLYHAFRDDRAKANQACVRRIARSSAQIFPITGTQWLYALPDEEVFAFQCSGRSETKGGFRLQGTGVFALPLHAPLWATTISYRHI